MSDMACHVIFRAPQDGVLKLKLCNIISAVFGREPLPKLKRLDDAFYAIGTYDTFVQNGRST